MWRYALLLLVAVFAVGGNAAAAEPGLVAHWSFDEGKGDVLRDKSGNENHGKIHGAEWVKLPKGYALRFDGKDDHVDCGAGPSLDLREHVSMEFWVWPERRSAVGMAGGEPGIVGKAFRNYVITQCFGKFWTYISGSGSNVAWPIVFRTWQHVASTYDGKRLRLYINGRLAAERELNVKINAGEHFWMGRSDGAVQYTKNAHFHGKITEVKVYNRVLGPAEILEHLRASARAKGFNVPTKVGLRIRAHPALGRIRATLDARGLRPLPEGTRLSADLCRAGSRKPVMQLETTGDHDVGVSELLFDAREAPAGNYIIRARAIGPDNVRIGEESSATLGWSGRPAEFKNVRILNNLCWELMNVSGALLSGAGDKHVFANPYEGWVFIRTTAELKNGAKLRISLDSDSADEAVIVHTEGGQSRLEAMRFLPAGRHTVHVGRQGDAKLEHIVIRAIPILQHAFYGSIVCVRPYGPYDWEFLSKDVLPNVNTMVQERSQTPPRHLDEWKRMGRKWIVLSDTWRMMPKESGEAAVNDVYEFLTGNAGLQHADMDGIIMDEFSGGDEPVYDVYRTVVERVHADPKFKGKVFMPYTHGKTLVAADRSTEFARACLEGGGYIAWERYLGEQPTEGAARAFIKRNLGDKMFEWEAALPGCTRRMIVVLGLMSAPNESLNVDPTVSYRAYMDMQLRHLATDPAFFGLGGVQEYFTFYSDEENVRWTGRLYRHYAIEGNTEPLIKDPYKLTHIRNPDFAHPFEGWTASPAEEGSVHVGKHAGASWLQGRYPRTSKGDTFLWMKRSAKKPNTFSQDIKDLTPGRLYSMKMFTSDYQDLVKERSRKTQNAISIRLDNVEILPGPKKSFQYTFPSCYAHHLGKFNKQHPYWINYHWRVFRAKGKIAKLTVSDWKGDTEPGGPIGQELMFNFIEVQPYLGD